MYEWIPEEVGVGSKEMAQFEYKGFKLSSDVSVYAVGRYFRGNLFFCLLSVCLSGFKIILGLFIRLSISVIIFEL